MDDGSSAGLQALFLAKSLITKDKACALYKFHHFHAILKKVGVKTFGRIKI